MKTLDSIMGVFDDRKETRAVRSSAENHCLSITKEEVFELSSQLSVPNSVAVRLVKRRIPAQLDRDILDQTCHP